MSRLYLTLVAIVAVAAIFVAYFAIWWVLAPRLAARDAARDLEALRRGGSK